MNYQYKRLLINNAYSLNTEVRFTLEVGQWVLVEQWSDMFSTLLEKHAPTRDKRVFPLVDERVQLTRKCRDGL